jgi:hypothetical protein
MAKRNGSGAGGGIKSNKLVHPKVQTGVRARAISERGTSQIGQSMGNHITERKGTVDGAVEKVRGSLRPSGGPGGIPLGNELSAKTVCGVGGSREVMKSGSQGQTGPVNPGLGRIADTKNQWPDTSK